VKIAAFASTVTVSRDEMLHDALIKGTIANEPASNDRYKNREGYELDGEICTKGRTGNDYNNAAQQNEYRPQASAIHIYHGSALARSL